MTYEERFATDWERVSHEEAVVRAFVLGIDAAHDRELPEGELDRLIHAVDTGYERHIVETGFEEGRRFVRAHRRGEAESSSLPEALETFDIDPFEFVEDRTRGEAIPPVLSRLPIANRIAPSTRLLRIPPLLRRK